MLAFTALKKKIDDFHESLPLIEMMTHPAMENRHWENLEKITNYTFNIDDELSLKSVIQAPLLKYKEEIEVGKTLVGVSTEPKPTKEKDIEAKLKSIINEWGSIVFKFTQFKNRGEILLKDSSEIMTKLEDSLVLISSLIINRLI